MRLYHFIFLLLLVGLSCKENQKGIWNGKTCAVVLTYDDGLNVHLDKVIPELDRYDMKGTFYVHTDSESFKKRRDEWKLAAADGHELGNHTIFHPCAGKSKKREWVNPDHDLDNYSVTDIISEITTASQALTAVDGKKSRTYAYTCGDTSVLDTSFVDDLKKIFPAARGVYRDQNSKGSIDLYDIKAYSISGHSAEDMIGQVKEAIENESLLVFLFHGVGGEHDLNCDESIHQELLTFINESKESIWVAPMIDVVNYLN